MEEECLSGQIDIYLPKLSSTDLKLVLLKRGESTEGKSNAISNKRILWRWIQKYGGSN